MTSSASLNRLVFILLLAGSALHAQTVDIPGNRTIDGALTAQSITNVFNPQYYSGADMCAKINAAILANVSSLATAIIDARTFVGTQPCATNPFAGVMGDVVVLLGEGVVIQTTSPWVTSSSGNAQIIGSGRGSNGRGTTIQAFGIFPAVCDGLAIGCPILRLGDGTGPAFGQRFENATLDCNGLTGCMGLYSTDIQEQSGAYHFSILNYSVMGILIDGSSNVGAGPFWAQHYTLFDGEVYALTFGATGTIGVKLIGGNNAAGGETSPGLVERITASGNSGHVIGTAFQFEQFWGGELIGLNAENATNGYQFGIIKPMNGVSGSDLRCANVTTNCVWITSNAPFSNNIVLTGIQNTPTVATNTIKDDMRGINCPDATVAQYVLGNGFPSGGFSFLSTCSVGGNATLNGLDLYNNADSSQVVVVNAGKTADENKTLQFQDRGVNKWSLQSTTTDQFLIFDHTLNRARLWFNPTDGNTYWNSNGTGAANINMEASNGTGGLKVGNGSGTNVFAVNGSGNMSVSGSSTLLGGAILGNVTGITQCLHASPSGAVTGTGADCGSGGGGGGVTGSNLTANRLVVGAGASAITVDNAMSTNGSGGLSVLGLTVSGASTFGGLIAANGGITTGPQNATVNRLNATAGTNYSGADSAIVPSVGWGTTPTVSAGGVDQGFRFGIAAGGSGIGANPTVKITFKDGAWTTNPTYICSRNDTTAPYNSPPLTWTENTTSLTVTFNGTPVSGQFYTIFCLTVGAAP